MSYAREVESVHPFDDALARSRVLHVAEGILVCLQGCTPEEAFTEMVCVARTAGQSTFTVARELMEVAMRASNTAAVKEHWVARRSLQDV
jgi:AmiR/NasT family two-component response regulator